MIICPQPWLISRGWGQLAAVGAAGADAGTRAVILAAAGRGFCAGVDIKEMQRTQAAEGGHEALLGANRGCAAAFGAATASNLYAVGSPGRRLV